MRLHHAAVSFAMLTSISVWAAGSQRDVVPRRVGQAMIAGSVTDDRGAPIRRALVTLSGGGADIARQVPSDDRGAFAFTALPAGRYTLSAEKPAWVTTFYGSRRVGRGPGTPIALGDGQRVADVAITLVRGAVITGRVLDEQDNPVASAQVRVFQARPVGTERRFIELPSPLISSTTDDRGRYRIFGLPPGEYTVRAVGGGGVALDVRQMTVQELAVADRLLNAPAAGRTPAVDPAPPDPPRITRAAMYYPGVIDVTQAQTFTLAAGEERTDVDIRSVLLRASRVEGVALSATGQPLMNMSTGLANVSAMSMWSSPGSIRAGDPTSPGKFLIPSIAPGRYLFFGAAAESMAGNAPPTMFVEQEITIGDRDITDVVLQFLPGSRVAGRLGFRVGGGPPPDPASIRVTLTPMPAIPGAAIPVPPAAGTSDRSFVFPSVAPGRYRLSVTAPGGWSLQAGLRDNRDVLDAPLEIRSGQHVDDLLLLLTDRPTVLTGTMFDRLGRPAPEYAVVVFSTDRAHWGTSPRRTSGIVKLGSDGTFTVTGLPPGEYFLSALVDADPEQLHDASFLEALAAAAVRVTLAAGEKTVQDIKIGG